MSLRLLIAFIISTNLYAEHTIKNLTYTGYQPYQTAQPYNSGYLQVSDAHRVFFEEFGNPQGVPVLVVHGGPGWGCSAAMSQFFDPAYYRIIMLDQRGSGRSLPFACMDDNTPQAAVHDMELLRTHLNIDQWILFGGSYGTLLSILYGETHPERITAFVLRGICLGRKDDYEHLFYGMGNFFPEAYNEFLSFFTQEEQQDLIGSFYTKCMTYGRAEGQKVADAFMYYDLLCARLYPDVATLKASLDANFTYAVTRAFAYYAYHKFFLEENQLINNIDTIKDIPAYIIHGRYDLICLPSIAYDLYTAWPSAELRFIVNGAHSGYEPAIVQALQTVMNELRA